MTFDLTIRFRNGWAVRIRGSVEWLKTRPRRVPLGRGSAFVVEGHDPRDNFREVRSPDRP